MRSSFDNWRKRARRRTRKGAAAPHSVCHVTDPRRRRLIKTIGLAVVGGICGAYNGIVRRLKDDYVLVDGWILKRSDVDELEA